MIEIHCAIIFMIIAALVAVSAKDLLSSVVAVGTVGVGLAMAFLLLKAPDLAIMQLVVEILSLVILIRATIRKDLPFSTSGRWYFNTAATIAFIGIFLFTAHRSIASLLPFGSLPETLYSTSEQFIRAQGKGKNIVTEIILAARPLDLLGEVAIVFAAIIGILAIARKAGYVKDSKR